MKKILTKYVVPTILAATSMVYADKQVNYKALPINEERIETRIKLLDSLQCIVDEKSEMAQYLFEAEVDKGYISEKSQKEIFETLEVAVEHANKVNNLSKNFSGKEYGNSLSEKSENLYNLLNTSLNGFDCGKPELEKALETNGLNIQIERVFSDYETYSILVSLYLGFFSFPFVYHTAKYFSKDERIKRAYENIKID